MESDIQVAGNYEDHIADRYKKHSPSAKAFEEDAQAAFEAGDTIPSTEPQELVGLNEDTQETLLRYQRNSIEAAVQGEALARAKAKGEAAEKPRPHIANVKGSQKMPASSFKDRKKAQDDKKFGMQKEMMLQSMREQEQGRSVVDLNFVDTVGQRMLATVAEGLYIGYENTARVAAIAATNVIDNIMPDIDSPHYNAWVSMLNDSSVKTKELMRPNFMPSIEGVEGIGYDFLRGMSQFLPNFLHFNKMLGNVQSLDKHIFTKGFIAGAPADALSFDPAEGNLHSVLRSLGTVEIKGEKFNLDTEYTRYMSSDLSDSQAEGRFRNALEGGVLGVLSEPVLQTLKGMYKSLPREAIAKKISGALFEGAKAARAFRDGLADTLEQRARSNFEQAQEAATREAEQTEKKTPPTGSPGSQKGAVGTGDQVSAPGALLPESRQRMVTAMTELAFARIMKGDLKVGFPEKWVETMGGAGKASANKGEGKQMLQEAWDNAVSFLKNGGTNPHWYSKMERSALMNMDATAEMTGQEILDAYMGGVKPNGKPIRPKWQYRTRFKQENQQPVDSPVNPMEIKFSGLEAWLKSNKDRVIPKDELVDFIRAHRVEVKVVELKQGRRSDTSMEAFQNEIKDDTEAFVENEMTQTGGLEEIDAENLYEQASIEIDEGDHTDEMWQQASRAALVNSTMSGWSDEILRSTAEIQRNAAGVLEAASLEELKARMTAEMMGRIDFEDSSITNEFDNRFSDVSDALVERGYTADEVSGVMGAVRDNLESAGGDVYWMENEQNNFLRSRMTSEGYELRDAARDVLVDRRHDLLVQDARRTNEPRYELDANPDYYVTQDRDGDWNYYVRNQHMSYYRDRDIAIRSMYAHAVKDGVLQSRAPKLDEAQIIKAGFKSSSYAEYTFADIDEFSYDDKYLVYGFVWKNTQMEKDRMLLESSMRKLNTPDPELEALHAERMMLAAKGSPRSSHFQEGDYGHVRMTFRKPKGSDEVVPHAEEFQADFLQAMTKAGSKTYTPAAALKVIENFEKISKIHEKETRAYKDSFTDMLEGEYTKWEEGGDSAFSLENLKKMVDDIKSAGKDLPQEIKNAIIVQKPEKEYTESTVKEYMRQLVDTMVQRISPSEPSLQYSSPGYAFGHALGVPDSLQTLQLQEEIGVANNLKLAAERGVNATPFDEKNFHRQMAGTIIKAMVDKGYKKLSWSRPWSEKGSRSTDRVVWREVVVPEYADADGVKQTTAFIVDSGGTREGMLRETDLNVHADKAVQNLYDKLDQNAIDEIAQEGFSNSLHYGIYRNPEDLLGHSGMEEIAAGTAKPQTRALARAWKRMVDGRKGYDSITDYDATQSKQWFEQPNVEMLEMAGYETNYKIKLPKALLSVIQEYDPKATINKGKQSLLYEREPTRAMSFPNGRMKPIGDAKGITENPYYEMSVDDVIAKWNMSEEFLRLSGVDTGDLYALTKVRYLPRFEASLPKDAAILYYLPNEKIRRMFNNKAAAEKVVKEYSTYDVEWIDLSGLYETIDGKEVRKTDGGVSVLGLAPGAALPAYMLGGEDDRSTEQQIQ